MTPRNFAIDPTGKWLFVANQESNEIRLLRIDSSSGPAFSRQSFAEALARINHPDLMLGIPLYSDIGSEHDYVVQARGAFEDTVLGLYNLARADVPVEIPVLSLKFRLGCLTLRTL